MALQKGKIVEMKEAIEEDIKKEAIAFANSAGGAIYVGVADDGSIVGVDSPDQAMQQVANMVGDSIKPDVTMFVHYEAITRRAAQEVTGLGQTAMGRLLKRMVAKRLLTPSGQGKNTKYIKRN